MHPTERTSEQRRRARAAPLALLLAAWGLMLGPVAHAVIAHGVPLLRSTEDEGWIRHRPASPGSPRAPELPRGHAHAPGVPDHFRLALLATEAPAMPAPVLVRVRHTPALLRPPPTLTRRWVQEQPQGP